MMPLVFKNDKHQTINQFNKSVSFNWAAGLPGVEVATVIEIPYANVGDAIVTAESARFLGHDLARAMKEYLQE